MAGAGWRQYRVDRWCLEQEETVLITPRPTAIERSDSGPISMFNPPGYVGHKHFLKRALSRRDFVRTAAGASALAAAANMAWPAVAFAAPKGGDATPRPIPGGTDLQFLIFQTHGQIFHFFFPAYGQEVSTITDFKGSVAAAEIQGSGVDNSGKTLTYDADMRFMSGEYVALDGRHRQGTFGFV
jgi:hypothetical protein